jgi:predicted nucleic acid-binding protein
VIYADSSALLRVLLGEPGPRAPLAAEAEVFASELAEVETFRALDRARLEGRLDDDEVARKSKELSDLLAGLHLVPVNREVVDLARATFPVPVRALDALHVATAQWLLKELGSAPPFWTHDRRQANAALSRALDVRGVDAEGDAPSPASR